MSEQEPESNDQAIENAIEAAVIQSLTLLTSGDTRGFGDVARPTMAVEIWLKSAPLDQVRGLLLATLRRWHKMRLKLGEYSNWANNRSFSSYACFRQLAASSWAL